MPRPDLYFSVDIEADGPIPGPYSMVSLGACVAGTYDGATFTAHPPERHTFYAELRPISDQWVPEALAVSGFSRERRSTAWTPRPGWSDFVAWVEEMCAEHGRGHAVFAAYPLGFDWLFTYWYLMAYAGRSPFSHGRHIDMKTLFTANQERRSTPRRSAGWAQSCSASVPTRTTPSMTRRDRPTCSRTCSASASAGGVNSRP